MLYTLTYKIERNKVAISPLFNALCKTATAFSRNLAQLCDRILFSGPRRR